MAFNFEKKKFHVENVDNVSHLKLLEIECSKLLYLQYFIQSCINPRLLCRFFPSCYRRTHHKVSRLKVANIKCRRVKKAREGSLFGTWE